MEEVENHGGMVEAPEVAANDTTSLRGRPNEFSERVTALLKLQPLNPLERPVFTILPRNAQ